MVKYIENYCLYESIGSGVYGKVYRAINNNDKKQYAIKVIPIVKFRQNKKLEECTVNEINILTNIEANQHIIKYFDMLKTTNNFYFIYEFCNGGTLQGLLSKQGKLSEQSALLIFKQLLEAFQILNKYNIMHRDMKPDNIFFHNGIIKLGDFGFCKNLNSADQMTRTMLGSPIYMAPQVLRGQIYSNKADIWSVGVVLYEMLFGHCPFQSNSIAKLIQVLNTKQLEFPSTISPFLKNLIQKMLTKDPMKRISWMQLFQLKISNQGSIQSQKVVNTLFSLNDAKGSQQSLTSTKYTPSNQISIQQQSSFQQINLQLQTNTNGVNSPQNINQLQNQSLDDRNFKKNRTSTTTQNVPNTTTLNNGTSNGSSNNINSVNSMNSSNGQCYSSTTTNTTNGSSQNNSSTNNNSNVNSLNSNQQQKSTSEHSKISEEHKLIIEGVKLSMQIIDVKLPNYCGYAYLILNKNISILSELLNRPFRKQILEILDKQLKQMKQEKQSISSKMFAYELKGLQDWKKYLRGKFFQQEKTIIIWYRLVNFLNCNNSSSMPNCKISPSAMAENVKSILY